MVSLRGVRLSSASLQRLMRSCEFGFFVPSTPELQLIFASLALRGRLPKKLLSRNPGTGVRFIRKFNNKFNHFCLAWPGLPRRLWVAWTRLSYGLFARRASEFGFFAALDALM